MKFRSDYTIMPESEIIKSLLCCKGDKKICPQCCPYINEANCESVRSEDIYLLLKTKDETILKLTKESQDSKTKREEKEYKRGYHDGEMASFEKYSERLETQDILLKVYQNKLKWINEFSSEEKLLLKKEIKK